MPKTARRRKSSAKKKRKKGSKRSGKLVIVVLALVGFLVLAEITSVIIGKIGSSKIFTVQNVMEFSGDNQSCGAFGAWDILAIPQGFVVSDQGHKRLLVFDRQGKFTQEIGKDKAGPPGFTELSCLTGDASGNFYVMDTWNGLIRGFDISGKPILKVDLNDKGFYGPRGVAWDGANFLIADTGSHRVVKVAPSGAVVGAWGKRGSGKLAFNNPYETAVDAQGNIYVLDQDNHRIQCLDTEGHYLREFSIGAAPSAEAVDAQRKLLYVSSTDGHFVKVFSLDGTLIGGMVEPGKNVEPVTDVRALSVLDNGDIAASKSGKIVIYHPIPVPAPTH